jgi:menaquinol-cytochrome c reductase iron-sulfur subunit
MNEKNTEDLQSRRPETPETMGRRRFLESLSIGLGAVCGVVLAIPAVGFVLAPLFRKPPELWRKVGKLDDFKVGQTVSVSYLDPSPLPWAGVTALTAAWLRRVKTDEFIAFAVNCSHLGCPVRWLADANLFMCPCHGGVYYSDGSVAAGPPPRPLTRYPVRIQNGEVQIQTRPLPLA